MTLQAGPSAPTIHADRVTPTTPGEDQLHSLTSRAPDDCPEAVRAMVMIAAKHDEMNQVLGELEFRLAHVLRDAEPQPPLDMGPACYTALGQQTMARYDEAVMLTERVRSILNRLAGV